MQTYKTWQEIPMSNFKRAWILAEEARHPVRQSRYRDPVQLP